MGPEREGRDEAIYRGLREIIEMEEYEPHPEVERFKQYVIELEKIDQETLQSRFDY